MRRRDVLGVGVLAAVGIAGCLGTGSETPDPDHAIVVDNDDTESHTIHVRIAGPSGIVHETTARIGANTERELYNLRAADPEGVEEFAITARVGERSDTADIRTSRCYGDVRITVSEGGVLGMTYSVC